MLITFLRPPMQSQSPGFLLLCVVTLFVIFQHALVKAAEPSAAYRSEAQSLVTTPYRSEAQSQVTASESTQCERVAESIRLKLGEPLALQLSSRKEHSRWNTRPDVLSVQAGPGRTHLLKAERPGFSELRLGFEADTAQGDASCKIWRIESIVDLQQAQALIADWIRQESRASSWSAPQLSLSARGSLIVLEGEVAQLDHRKALESLMSQWLDAQAFPGLRLVNWVHVRPAEQIMLEVRIAEVSSRLLDKLGIDWQIGKEQPVSAGFGQWGAQAGFSAGAAALVRLMRGAAVLGIDAEASRSQWRLLAQPNLMAQSGSEAQFLSGGKVFIPISIQQGQGEQASISTRLDEREYGVSLKFTPRLMSDGRIELKVVPEVSELSRDGVMVSAGERGSVLPLVTVRKASTTVTLDDGQSYVVGGLINFGEERGRRGLPGLVESRLLSGLLGSNDHHQHQSELVFVVTPRRLIRDQGAN
jgi:pilus assembly protein CpaC